MSDTICPPAPSDSEDTPTRRGLGSRLLAVVWEVAAVAGAIAAVLAGIAWLQSPSSYAAVTPGPVTDLRAAITDLPADADPSVADGPPVYLTTVEASRLTWAGWLRTLLPGDGTRVADLRSDIPEWQRPAAARLRMRLSQRTAVAVAADLTGRPQPDVEGLQVWAVTDAAQDTTIDPGDLIVAVDGAPAASSDMLDQAVAAAAVVHLTVRELNGDRPVTLEVPDGTDGAADLGLVADPLYAGSSPTFDLPGVTGGSGGLMMTVLTVDAFTAGDLLAGRTVAGTGTVSADGTVGPVEGVDAKAAAAAAAGAEVFFAPAGTSVQVDGLTVVQVQTVADAVAWLCSHGGAGPC